jgi:membrane-associated protease RseP (regulator of RpoE activity)
MRVRTVLLIALAGTLAFADGAQAQFRRGGFGGRGMGGYGGMGGMYGGRGYYGGYGGYGYGGYGYGMPYYGSGYNSGYYAPGSTYYAPSVVSPAPTTSYYQPSADAAPAVNPNVPNGLQVTEVFDNTAAKKAGLRAGDIITAVGGTRVQSFEELQQALARSNGEVDVTFVDASKGKTDKARVKPQDGKIGVAVVPVGQ